jgi:hypothetical protein
MGKIFTSIGELINYVIGSEMLIQLLILIVYIVTAVILAVTARLIYKSVKATERTMQAQLYIRLWEYYASKEMFESLRLLRIVEDSKPFKEWKGADPYTLVSDIAEVQLSRIKSSIEEAEKDYRHYQRFVKYYFLRIYHLDEQSFLPEHLVKDLLSVDGIKIFFEVVKPLEYLENEKFNSSNFDALYKRAKKLRVKELPRKLWRKRTVSKKAPSPSQKTP